MTQLLTRLSAPFAAFVATLLSISPVAAVGGGCDEPGLNLIDVGPTVIDLPARFCDAEKGLPQVLLIGIVTVFNLLAIGIVLALGLRLAIIAFAALGALNNDDKSGADGKSATYVVRSTILSIVQALLVAVVGFLVAVNAPNMLLGFGDSMVNGVGKCGADLTNSGECFTWLAYTKPFDGIAARAQALLGLVVIVYGSYLLARTWLGYLMKTEYQEFGAAGAKTEMKLDQLKSALTRSVSIGLVTGIAFLAIVSGPDLFSQSILDLGSTVIDSGSGCPDGNC